MAVSDVKDRIHTFDAVPVVTGVHCAAKPNDTQCVGTMLYDQHTRIVRGTEIEEHRHRCSVCSAFEWLGEKYPRVDYRKADPQPTLASSEESK